MTYGFLKGLRVIESSAFVAAPLGGLTLAQHGADVIRIDMIGGGIDYARWPVMPNGRSLYWTGLNKGKRSLAVDLRKPEGRALVADLVTAQESGVLLTNVAAPWLSHEKLAQARPDVITCTIEGNPDGTTAVDYTVNCATGYPLITGDAGADRPVNHVLPAWDVACAGQAAFAVLAAHTRRQVSGEGAEIRISLADVAFSTLSHLGVLADAELLDHERPAIGNDVYGGFGRDFACRDGRRIMVIAISARQWQSLVAACGLADVVGAIEAGKGLSLALEADRYAARDAIADAIRPWIAARDLSEIAVAFDAAGVCWGDYKSARQLVSGDRRVSTENPVFQMIETQGAGRHIAAGATARFAGIERGPVVAAPVLGEHTDAVLSDVLGLSSGAIGKLHDQGIVAGPEADPSMGAQFR